MYDKIFYFIIVVLWICEVGTRKTWLGLAKTIVAWSGILGLILYFNLW